MRLTLELPYNVMRKAWGGCWFELRHEVALGFSSVERCRSVQMPHGFRLVRRMA